HVAAAHLLATERGEAGRMEVEMLHGMAPAQARAVRAATGSVLLYVPAVDPADLDVAVGYLVRRLEENAAPQNFLHAMTAGAAALDAQEAAFRAAVAEAGRVDRTPRRLRAAAPGGAEPEFWNVPDLDPALEPVRERAARMREGTVTPAEPAPLVPVRTTH